MTKFITADATSRRSPSLLVQLAGIRGDDSLSYLVSRAEITSLSGRSCIKGSRSFRLQLQTAIYICSRHHAQVSSNGPSAFICRHDLKRT